MPDLSLQNAYVLITAPVAELITVTDAKKQMRIEHSDNDALTEGLIYLAFIWALHVKIGKHDTPILMPQTQVSLDKLAHDREMKSAEQALKSTVSKLDSIELALGIGDKFFIHHLNQRSGLNIFDFIESLGSATVGKMKCKP